jgi:S1-C subfamily serine protease
VIDVEPGSLAEKAGIAAGDVIQTIDGFSITAQKDQAIEVVRQSRVGQTIQVHLKCDGADVTLDVKMSPPAPRPRLTTPTPLPASDDYL